MNRVFISCIGLLSALVVFESAKADEDVVKPRRERAAAPARVAPQRAAPTQSSNWSGGQVGGSNGVSSVNNNFVEPGAFICPFGSSFGSNCFETPFQFSGHKAAYTIGPFVGYRVQLGAWVVGLEGDWSYKNSETSLNQSSSTSIAVSSFSSGSSSTITSNYLRTDQFSGSVKQKSDSSIRARVGMLVTPWSLLYVTGGVAFGQISGSFAYTGKPVLLLSIIVVLLHILVPDRYRNDRSELERHAGWQHGRRRLGNGDCAAGGRRGPSTGTRISAPTPRPSVSTPLALAAVPRRPAASAST